MALTRFRESFDTSPVWEKAHFLSNEDANKYQEAIARIPKARLQESCTKDKVQESIDYLSGFYNQETLRPLQEGLEKFKEGSELKTKIWTVPVSRFGNVCGNNRVYTDKLWENVKKQESNWKGITGLCDHPKDLDDPGELKYACIVWLDLQVDYTNNLIWGTGIFVGALGRLLQEIIEVGGRVGFSSSGYGEMMPGTNIVNPDTYQIERIADVVINPSQNVYGALDANEVAIDPVTQSKVINYTRQQPILENNNKENLEMSKLEENEAVAQGTTQAVANPQAKAPVQNAVPQSAILNPQAATPTTPAPAEKQEVPVEPAQTAAAPVTTPETTATPAPEAVAVQPVATPATQPQTIVEGTKGNKFMLEKYVESFFNNTLPTLTGEEKVSALETLKEELIAANDTKFLEKTETLLKEAQENSKVLQEDTEKFLKDNELTSLNEATEIIESLEESIQTLVGDKEGNTKLIETLLTRNKELRAALDKEKVLKDFKCNLNTTRESKTQDELTKARDFNKKLIEDHKQFVESLSLKEAVKLEKKDTAFEQLMESNKQLERKVRHTSKALVKEQNNSKVLLEKLNKAKKYAESKIALAESFKAQLDKLEERAEKAEEKYINLKENIEYEKNPMMHLEQSPLSQVSKYLNLKEDCGRAVDVYFNDLLSRYGESIEPFKKQILGCNTQSEATRVFLANKDKIDQNFREAQAAALTPSISSYKQRSSYLREAGMPIPEDDNVDFANASMRDRMKRFGFV